MMMFYLIEKNLYLENVGQFVSWMYKQQGRLSERMKSYTHITGVDRIIHSQKALAHLIGA